MADETPLFEVRCGFTFRNNLYQKLYFSKQCKLNGICEWPLSSIKIYRERIDLVPFPKSNTFTIKLNDVTSVKNSIFSGTIITLKNPDLAKYLILITFSYLPTRLYYQLKNISEKYNLGIKFE